MECRSRAGIDLTPGTVAFGVLVVVLLALAAISMGGLSLLPAPDEDDYDRTTVTVIDDGGNELATVDVRVADTFYKRYVGLSETESLGADEGMLFVHDEPGSYAYVMRDMAFPIDIVFIDADGTITSIHHAPVEPDAGEGELTEYEGYGQYVLEVPYRYTTEAGIEVGHRVRIDGY